MSSRLPAPLKRAARAVLGSRAEPLYFSLLYRYWRMTDGRLRTSVRRLRELKDKPPAERCFIMGNGPSLRKMDLSPLASEVTFGLNRIYMLFETLGFSTTYLVSVNKLFIEQVGEEIAAVDCPKFISYRARDHIRFTEDTMFVFPHAGPKFYPDVTRGVWEGSTVTNVALQLAFHIGFRKVILIGVDHCFATQGEPHKEVVSPGGDPNHFDPDYFGKDFRWQLPDLEMSELAYRMAKEHYERAGGQILDATVEGKLQVFPKVDYQSLFG